jgi:O-antigen/teichoic acid export membrane protein
VASCDSVAGDVQKVAKGAGLALLGNAVGKGLFFVSQVMAARILGVEAFGLFSLGLATIKVTEILSRLGLHAGGMRFIAIYKNTEKAKVKGFFISATIITILTGITLGIVIYAFSSELAGRIFHRSDLRDTLRLFALSTPFVAGMTVVTSLMQGSQNLKYTVLTRDFLQPIGFTLCLCISTVFEEPLRVVLYGFLGSHAFAFLIGLFLSTKLFPELRDGSVRARYEVGALLRYSAPLLFLGFVQCLLGWNDTLMLGALGSVEQVAIYRAASQIPLAMTVFLLASNSIYAPVAAELYARRELARLNRVFKTTTRWITYASVPTFVYILMTSDPIMCLFGKEYGRSGVPVLVTLSLGQLINCITGGVGYTLTMSGKQNVQLANTIVMLAISAGLNIVLIPKLGPLGAAVSQAIALGMVNLISLYEVYDLHRLFPYEWRLVLLGIPVAVSVLTLILANRLELGETIQAGVNLGCVVLPFSIHIVLTANDEDKFLLRLFMRSILARGRKGAD